MAVRLLAYCPFGKAFFHLPGRTVEMPVQEFDRLFNISVDRCSHYLAMFRKSVAGWITLQPADGAIPFGGIEQHFADFDQPSGSARADNVRVELPVRLMPLRRPSCRSLDTVLSRQPVKPDKHALLPGSITPRDRLTKSYFIQPAARKRQFLQVLDADARDGESSLGGLGH